MREAAFVQRNKEKWSNIETNLKNKDQTNPDQVAEDYLQLTNDLAYAQTFYPKSKIKEYLNELTIYTHQTIYRDRKSSKSQLVHFFAFDIPKAVYEMRKPLFYSLLLTLLATLIGVLSAHYDAQFVRLILGDGYVNNTIDNIEAGNPAGIYQSGNALGSFLAITINNIRVAFLAFAFGLFFSVGTGFVLFQNGIMLGAFHYFFYQYGVLPEAMSGIWIHGAFEISVIIIAGGCGIALGNSFMFPGTYKRIDSFKRQVKQAGIILTSTIPFFIVAGGLEGFITRYYQVSLFLSLSIIFISFSIILFYYVYYPIKIARKNQWHSSISLS